MNNNKYGKEVFRKMLHMLVLAGVIAWSHYCDDWRYSAVVFLLAVLILFPLVYLLSKIPGVSAFFNARKKGEFSYSMMALGIMYAIVCSVCWGFLGERLLAIACIVAWGPGDAAAALIGKAFGRHKIGKDKRKSLEGSLSMFFFSFLAVLITLKIYGKYSLLATIVVAALTAIASTLAELFDTRGYDTFYCPVAAMIVLFIGELILR